MIDKPIALPQNYCPELVVLQTCNQNAQIFSQYDGSTKLMSTYLLASAMMMFSADTEDDSKSEYPTILDINHHINILGIRR